MGGEHRSSTRDADSRLRIYRNGPHRNCWDEKSVSRVPEGGVLKPTRLGPGDLTLRIEQ